MSQIESPQNPRLKAVRRLHTKRERARSATFLAEGEDLIAAAQRAGRPVLEGYRLAGCGLGDESFHDVERSALASVSALGSSTRVLAVYEQRWAPAAGPLCVYLHRVGDPGNVGTVLRSAQAFGASCVALGPGCADPHSPKAVRASMGAIFTAKLARVSDLAQLPGELIALAVDAEETLRGPFDDGQAATATSEPDAADSTSRVSITLLIGAEREGLPDTVTAACDRVVRIPIASDSLNAAMAATVALYEMTCQGGRHHDTVPAS
ncbi:MAG TPA: RNA methyltransferase [Solirubrobacteraceae bacterium]|jgi:TrmH family RNA methyltransferase|nr:RNA methyltransferase [Solirubrobacteraceae bacterium]